MNNGIIEGLTNILGKEDRGIIFQLTDEETDQVKMFIGLRNYDNVNELKILRNYLVLVLSKELQNPNKFRLCQMFMTVITSLIDDKIYNLGGQI